MALWAYIFAAAWLSSILPPIPWQMSTIFIGAGIAHMVCEYVYRHRLAPEKQQS